MSYSTIYGIDNELKGYELGEFTNSWLFSPIIWDALSEKHIPELLQKPYGFKTSLINDPTGELDKTLNNIINNCDNISDRLCWELAGQQVFFTKDKQMIGEAIIEFANQNKKYSINREGEYVLEMEHILERFEEIANFIKGIDENKYQYFVFKNTSVDDNVISWFRDYGSDDELIMRSLKDVDKYVTEFVKIKNGKIEEFIPNIKF